MAMQTDGTGQQGKPTERSKQIMVMDGAGAQSVRRPEIIGSSVTKTIRAVTEPQSGDARHERIAVAAYYLAESRGFQPGFETRDWLTAEAQVDALDFPAA